MRSLVLSGGGAKGSFQVGALEYLRTKGELDSFDEIVGVSVGSLNACLYAMSIKDSDYPDLPTHLWRETTQEDVYHKQSVPAVIWSILRGRVGIYSNDALRRSLGLWIAPHKFKCRVRIGYTDLNTGKFLVSQWPGAIRVTDFLDDVWASATMPVIWPPVMDHYVDGGLRNITPIGDVIDRGADQIVAILCSPIEANSVVVSTDPAVIKGPGRLENVAKRSLDIALNEIAANDIRQAVFVNKLVGQAKAAGVTLKHPSNGRDLIAADLKVIAPPVGWQMGDTLDFSKAAFAARYAIGWKSAQRVFPPQLKGPIIG